MVFVLLFQSPYLTDLRMYVPLEFFSRSFQNLPALLFNRSQPLVQLACQSFGFGADAVRLVPRLGGLDTQLVDVGQHVLGAQIVCRDCPACCLDDVTW